MISRILGGSFVLFVFVLGCITLHLSSPTRDGTCAPALEVWGHAVEWVFFNSLCWAFCLIKPEDSGLLILGKLTILLLSFSVFSFCHKSPHWYQEAASQEVVSECHKNQQVISSISGVISFFFFLRTLWLIKGYVCMTSYQLNQKWI